MDILDTHQGLPHCISKEQVFEDCLLLYTSRPKQVLKEYPFRITYKNEKAILILVVSAEVCFQPFGRLPTSRHLMEEMCWF